MAAADIYMCHMFITRRVHGGFYGFDLKKGNGHLGKLNMNVLDSSMIKKIAHDSKSKRRKQRCTYNPCGLTAVRERLQELFFSD